MEAGLVIIGGSHAGAQLAASAREAGYARPITILCDEPVAPYQRPPLSKAYILGKIGVADLWLRGDAFYRDKQIGLELNCRATAIDRAGQTVTTADGRTFPYEWLALATGARIREIPVPGATLDGVCYIRTMADSDFIRARLDRIARVAVIGGGFIGLEAASALRSLGKEVTVIEAQDRLMARAVGATISGFYADRHRDRGVRLMFGAGVTEIQGADGKVTAVLTTGGERVDADLVIVGIGVLPNVELAQAAGLECSNGIVVDRFARTSDPRILAVGDCSRHPSAFAGGMIRLESVQNAVDQAKTAGALVGGQEKPHDAVCWFWSDQYEYKLQMVGLSSGTDREVVRGSMVENKFSVFYFAGDRLRAVDSVSKPADHMHARKLLAAGARITPEQAADPAVDLKALAS
jgi:3-phenylpropionate/trans-cinnamate dioxygenase ferredoxin reductase subunit